MTTDSPRWFTSSYSSNGGNCVEVAVNLAATTGVPVRDTKAVEAGTLHFPASPWFAFITSAQGHAV
ncbi:DUF397 domain-containing protein [Streptomyces sp. NPDC047017]|uniref:DUF397 domain-containing protein n=1 Tax=Streptomyces sp. NPDC047017 TaxID=3155024 RepID=UPI0033E934F0